MNFLSAILHAGIGYGIRRKSWPSGYILFLDGLHNLRWLEEKEIPETLGEPICELYKGGNMHLAGEALAATDWEVI